MQAALRNCEWDVFEAHYDHSSEPVRCVYRRAANESKFSPWVLVGPSALMRRLGLSGLGLYALRGFKYGDYIGQFQGSDEGHFASREEAMSSRRARQLLRQGHDKLLTIRASKGPGVQLIDSETGGAPFLQYSNDPRNTALTPNTHVTPHGYMRVVHSRVSPFRFDRSLDENVSAELRWDYGSGYWDFHDGPSASEESDDESD